MKDRIVEKFTDVLYHMTSIGNAADIVRSNRFLLSPVFAKETERNLDDNDELFYMSTSRTMSNSLYQNYPSKPVVIVLDGRKLGYRYKIRPVNYFNMSQRNKSSESEDRILSHKPFIDNALDYIVGFHVFFDVEGGVRPNLDDARAVMTLMKSGKPVYIHDNEKDMLSLNKNNSSNLIDFDIERKKVVYSVPDFRIIKKKKMKRNEDRRVKRRYDLDDWMTLLFSPVSSYNRFDYEMKQLVRDVVYGSHGLNEMQKDFRNAYKKRRESLTNIAAFMKRNGMKDLDDLHSFLKDKWKAVYTRK